MNEIITQDGEIITAPGNPEQLSMAIGLTRAEIDQQIATAHAYPRSISRATTNTLSLVTMDEDSAKECNYALPRGGKPITGPSIRLAEIVAGQYGNCRIGARVVHVDRGEKYVEAEGVFHDLETNTATTARVRRRIVDSKGKLYSEDMIIVTGNAACSIAKRNAILGGVPKAVWNKAYQAALATIKGDIKTLSERRGAVLKAFAAFGVKPEQIFAAIDVSGLDDITLEHIPTLTGMHSALKNGEATVEEMFNLGSGGSGGGERKTMGAKLDDVAGGGQKAGAQDKPVESATESDKTQKASGQPAGSESSPATGSAAATGDEIEAARDRGGEAYHRGMSRKAMPGEYRDVPALSEAWLAGYDAEKDGADGQQ